MPTPNLKNNLSIARNWTVTAIHCYDIAHDCGKCEEVPESAKPPVCKMRQTVETLLSRFGPPDRQFFEGVQVTACQKRVLDYLACNPHVTIAQIVKACDSTRTMVESALSAIRHTGMLKRQQKWEPMKNGVRNQVNEFTLDISSKRRAVSNG